MRVFLAAVLAAIILGAGALFALNATQRTAAKAYTTEGARINPAWSWRRLLKRDQAKVGQKMTAAGAAIRPGTMSAGIGGDECDVSGALQWLFVDFGTSATGDEGADCS
jgi:hypothetical protein